MSETENGAPAPTPAPRTRGLKPAWQKGQSGNPKGRAKGARARFADAFCADLLEAWKELGPVAFQLAAKTDPVGFLNVCARIIPKEHGLSEETAIRADSWIENIARLSKMRAQEALQ